MRISGVQDERHSTLVETRAERGSVAIAQSKIQDRGGQVRMIDETQTVANCASVIHGCASGLQTINYIECDQWFVLKRQDRMSR